MSDGIGVEKDSFKAEYWCELLVIKRKQDFNQV